MAAIIIVGLGSGSSGALTLQARDALLQAAELHLVGGCVLSGDIEMAAHRCPQSPDFDTADLACHVVDRAKNVAEVTIGVPGDPGDWQPLLDEINAMATSSGIVVSRVPGVSMVSSVLSALGLGAVPGIYLTTAVQLAAKAHPAFGSECPALVMRLCSNPYTAVLQKTLLNQYRPDFRVALVHCAGQKGEMVEWVALEELNDSSHIQQMSTLFLPLQDEMGGFSRLQGTVAQLRGPGGCPWDRKQTHRSLRASLLEEAYETLAAIESDDRAMLAEELGDLLLQVVMHTQIAVDENEFDMATVVAGINKKMLSRHPHVFAGLSVDDVEDVLSNWDDIKAAEKKAAKNGDGGVLAGIPDVLPALARAQTYQRRATRAGFEWPELSGVVKKLREEIDGLFTAGSPDQKSAETGNLLFTLVNIARCLDVDAESALREASSCFRSHFESIEARAREQGGGIEGQSEVVN